MIFLRIIEMYNRKFYLPKKIRFFADKFILNFWLVLKKNTVRIRNWILNESRLIPKKIAYYTNFIWSKFRNKVDSYFDNFHQYEINKKGDISNYWETVSNHKNSLSDKEDSEKDEGEKE